MTALQYPVCNWRLSPQREAVFRFCEGYVQKHGHMPSSKQVARHMGWKNEKNVCSALQALVALGMMRVVERTPSGRGWAYQFEIAECQTSKSMCET